MCCPFEVSRSSIVIIDGLWPMWWNLLKIPC
uniref:Uncharacterized protein n=1 Tax=Trichinella nativa TaxID=6335 RepID=A0A0V1KIT0_9BILA